MGVCGPSTSPSIQNPCVVIDGKQRLNTAGGWQPARGTDESEQSILVETIYLLTVSN